MTSRVRGLGRGVRALVGGALALAASGCEPSVSAMHYEVHMRPSFAAADPTAVLDATDAWSAAVPGLTFNVTLSDDVCLPVGGPCMRIGLYPADEIIARCSAEFGASECASLGGFTDSPGGIGYTADVMVAPFLIGHATTHEMGHAIGLQHVPDASAVMFWEEGPRLPDAVTPDAADVAEFWRVRGVRGR